MAGWMRVLDRSRGLALVVVALMVLGLALRAPAFVHGFVLDDLAQLAMLEGVYPVPRAPWDLFRFSSGEPAEVATLIRRGSLAWWSAPDLRFAAWRPLSSLLIALDHALWGRAPLLDHVHSALWWGAVVASAAVVARRVARPVVALLAVALFALDECHGIALAWLANRNVYVSALFGLWALALHVRAREAGRAPGLAPPLLLMASLAGGEHGLLPLAYLVTYEGVVAHGPWRQRLRALAPAAGVALVYVLVHRLGGYGARGSGVYLDPLTDPVGFARAVGWRVPALWAQLVLAWPVEGLMLDVAGRAPRAWVGLAAAAGLALLVRGLMPRAARRWAWGALLGTGLATVPLAGAFVSARLLVIPELAVAGLYAGFVACAWRGLGARRLIAHALVAGHLVLAPAFAARTLARVVEVDRGTTRALAADPPGAGDWSGRRVIVLAAVDAATMLYAPYVRWLRGAALPASYLVLSQAPRPHRVRRIDDHPLELEPIGAALLESPSETLFRAPSRPLPAGSTIDLGYGTIRVVRASGGHPTRIRLRLRAPLDDPGHLFLQVTRAGFVPVPVPAPGAVLSLPPAPLPVRGPVHPEGER